MKFTLTVTRAVPNNAFEVEVLRGLGFVINDTRTRADQPPDYRVVGTTTIELLKLQQLTELRERVGIPILLRDGETLELCNARPEDFRR